MTRFRGNVRTWWIAGVVTAVVAIVALVNRPARPIAVLVQAAETLEYRVTEARLSGGFSYRPLAPVTRGEDTQSTNVPVTVLNAAASARGRRREEADAAERHMAGLSHLMLRQWTAAADTLDEALRVQTQRESRADALATSSDADLLADLAAAHHAAGRHTAEPQHYVIAAEAAERAWRLVKNPETAWNRALAIESLHLPALTRMAWRDYLALDPRSPWANEVRERVRKLEAPTVSRLWNESLRHLERAVTAGDDATTERIVREFPMQARHECEQTILPEWAASSNGTNARQLALCRAVGDVLRQSSGESLLFETVAAIDAADHQDHAAIVRALTLYHQAVQSRVAYRRTEACHQLPMALKALQTAGLPLAHKARMYTADCNRYVDDQRVIAETDAWLAEASFPARRYPALVANLRWIRGLSNMRLGRPQAAIGEYETAHALFTQLGESESVAAMNVMLTEAYEYVGDSEAAWSQGFAALEALAASGSKQPQLLEVWRLCAINAMRERLPSTAMLFLDQHLLELTTPAVFDTRFRQLLFRGAIHRALGDEVAAATDVRNAMAVIARIPDPAVREEALRAPDVVRSRLSETRSVVERERIVRDAVEFARQRTFQFRLSQLYLEEGLEHAHAGRPDAAKTALYQALDQVEQERVTVTDERQRGTLVESRQPVHEALIALLCRGGEYGRAFDVVERGRARSLMDRLAQRPEPFRNLANTGSIAASLPVDTALIEFAQVGESFAAWIVSSGGVRVVAVRLDLPELQRKVERFRLAVRARDDAAARKASSALYDDLIRPWYRHARRFARLVFVPDERTARLPFAALLDRDTGRFVLEHHVVLIAPSANAFVACAARDRERAPRTGPTLVVAPAVFQSSAGGDALLAASRKELSDVGSSYDRALLLAGPLATREAFLNHAPRARVIHFAGHGDEGGRGLPRLMFAASPGNGPDALRADDIRTLQLDQTRVVVLSACVTGSDDGTSMQGTSSLARAFLAAGSPVVVATFWDVEDRAAADLSRRLHAELARGHDAASALRLAQLQVLQSRKAGARQIGSWAAFAAIGGTTNQRR